MDTHSSLHRPVSARGSPLSLAERVALYARQASAANNAAVLRNVPKPTTDEMAAYVEELKHSGVSLYEDPSFLRILLTDTDYDMVCREVLDLHDAVVWHKTQEGRRGTAASTLELLLESTHVFSAEEIRAARFATQCLAPLTCTELSKSIPPGAELITGNVGPGNGSRTMLDNRDEKQLLGPVYSIASVHGSNSAGRSPRMPPTMSECSSFIGEANSAPLAQSIPSDGSSEVVAEQVDHERNDLPTPLRELEVSRASRQLPSTQLKRAVNDETVAVGATQEGTLPPERKESIILHKIADCVGNSTVEECSDTSEVEVVRLRLDDSGFVTIEGEVPPALVKCRQDDPQLRSHREQNDQVTCIKGRGALQTKSDASPRSDVEVLVQTLDRRIFDERDVDQEDHAIAKDASTLKGFEEIFSSRLIHPHIIVREDQGGLLTVNTGDTSSSPSFGCVSEVIEDIEGAAPSPEIPVTISNDEDASEKFVRCPKPSGEVDSQLIASHKRTEAYEVGDAVEVRYRGWNHFLRGEIAVALGNGRYNIRYTDGEYETDVADENIRPFETSLGYDDPTDRVMHEGGSPFTKPMSERCSSAQGFASKTLQSEDLEAQPSTPLSKDSVYEPPKQKHIEELKGPEKAIKIIQHDETPLIQEAQKLIDEVHWENDHSGLAVLDDCTAVDEISEDDDNEFEMDRILQTSARLTGTLKARDSSTKSQLSQGSTQRKSIEKRLNEARSVEIPPSTRRYVTPPNRSCRVVERPKSVSHTTSSRNGSATPRTKERRVDHPHVSWKELEEWKNVDLILNRKRRVVASGQVEGSDVPWGEEFASIQSLKRFAAQYPDVLREHIESKLREVVNADVIRGAVRPTTTRATSAAREALLLVKDLAFLLRHRLAPFLETILPVVLPAVFHSQRRFLCDTAYEVLEALVAHCSTRRLAVALLNQALRFPRDDMRLVNLTCLYVEKCLASLSMDSIQELMARSTSITLEAIAELLTCKSAACQNSLQKSLLLIQQAVGEDTMEQLLKDHLIGHLLSLVQKHLALAESAARNVARSPSASPKKIQHQNNGIPVKGASASSSSAGLSIMQRMLMQRQNRILPAPE